MAKPRETGSNLVKNEQGEIEKYLFYRGIGNFSLPVDVKFDQRGSLSVTNTSGYDIPFIYIYDHQNTDSATVWGSGALSAGRSTTYTKPVKYYSDDTSIPQYTDFVGALFSSGLTREEALALLHTWDAGYFQTTGFKIFWIVPRELTDRILPIQISPKPDSLARVLVGKTEILTPDFEQMLLNYYESHGNLDGWASDRYHLAYMQRVKELLPVAEVKNSNDHQFAIVPNPATSTIRIKGADEKTPVTIRNILGEVVLKTSEVPSDLDIHTFPTGLYFVTLAEGTHVETIKLMKD